MISLFRIDERLIHGQVAYAWTNNYKSQALVVITEKEKSDLEKMTLKLACPRDLRCFILTVDEGIAWLNKFASKKVFIVSDSLAVARELIEKGIEVETLNVGGLYFKEGRTQYTTTVFLDRAMEEDLKAIRALGTKIDVRATPSDKSVDLRKELGE